MTGQDRRRRPGLAVIAACIAVPAAVVLWAVFGLGIPPRMILGDPSTFTEQPAYLGLISDLGFVGWWTAAVACLIAASVTPVATYRRALVVGGVLSAVLCLDDLMMLHETFGEKIFFPFYVVASALYLWRERALHRRVGPALLVTALALLATSLAIDSVADLAEGHPAWFDHAARSWLHVDLAAWSAGRNPAVDDLHSTGVFQPMRMALDDWRRIAEDGSKFAGIVSWAVYHVYLARFCLVSGGEGRE